MKHNIVIAAGSQVFEFEGEIVELEDEHILLRAKRGDIYIERKYLVFIQMLNEEVVEEPAPAPEIIVEQPEPLPVVVRSPKVDQAARFIKQRLRKDPLEDKLIEKLVPPSQFPDDADDDYVMEETDEEDLEAMKNVVAAFHGPNHPIAKATNLQQAVKAAMQNTDKDLSMNMGNVEYKNPLQTILGMSNAGTKKTRNS